MTNFASQPAREPNPYNTLPFNPYAAELSPAQVEAINRGATIDLYFVPHSKHPQECDAVARVAESMDAARHFVAFEGFGQPPATNDPKYRNGQPDTERIAAHRQQMARDATAALEVVRGHNVASPIDSIGLARRICQARHVPLVVADLNREDVAIWQETQQPTSATLLPRRAASEAYFTGSCPQLDFDTAATGYRDVLENANDAIMTRDGVAHTDYRWGALNDQRDRVAVNTIGNTTYEQLQFQPQPPGEKLGVIAFMGLEHQGGMEEYFRQAGIPVRSHLMGSDFQFREITHPLPKSDHEAYRFATAYFWFETDRGKKLGIDYAVMGMAIREIPLNDLRVVYETHRQNLLDAHSLLQTTPGAVAPQIEAATSKLASNLWAVWQRTRPQGPAAA